MITPEEFLSLLNSLREQSVTVHTEQGELKVPICLCSFSLSSYFHCSSCTHIHFRVILTVPVALTIIFS